MKLTKRIIPLLMVFSIGFSCVVPVYAVDVPGVDVEIGIGDFFGWADRHGNMLSNFWGHIFNWNVCPQSPNTDGLHSFVEKRTQVHGQVGYYLVCEYCGRSAGEVAAPSYNDYVADLPASTYGSDGRLSWRIPVDRFEFLQGGSLVSYSGGTTYSVVLQYGSYTYAKGIFSKFVAPVTGNYTLYEYAYSSSDYRLYSEGGTYFVYSTDSFSNRSHGYHLSRFGSSQLANVHFAPASGELLEFSAAGNRGIAAGETIFTGTDYFQVVLFTSNSLAPMTGYWEVRCTPVTLGDTYNIDSRPSGITGDYGIIGDNGQITKVESNTIINETNNTIYNPATGETHTLSDWSYNYTDRSYTATTTSGDTITVTYGDEYVIIKEGDITYNVYYIIQGSGSGETPGPGGSHTHSYTSSITREASCTTTGVQTFTCECGDSYIKVLPVLGHDWVVKDQVLTEYDEDGEVVTQGYIIYRCTRCGEEKKSTDGKAPEGSTDSSSLWSKIGELLGSLGGGLLKLLGQFFGGILDALISLAEMITEKLSTILAMVLGWFAEIPALFTGFLDFLAAMFSFLPEEMMLLLTFGLACVIFIGILKAIRGR